MSRRRILLATLGSAGDLFPLLPVLERLGRDEHDVRCATTRSLGLYLRSVQIPSLALGDGREMRVFDDEQLFTTRFDGWESWHHTVNRYVVGNLQQDTSSLRAYLRDWKPHAIVVSGFAVAARIVGHALSVPVVELSIYPQHQRMATDGIHFAPRYLREVERVAGPDVLAVAPVSYLAWGAPADVLLHDDALLGAVGAGPQPVGFPYWDASPARAEDASRLERWIASASDTGILVTLGSFVGAASRRSWVEVADAIARLGVRAAFVGVRSRWAEEQFAGRDDLLCVGFLPLSRYLPEFDVVIHHGGIGTTFAAIRAGRPAVVLPQAFDQSFNARLVAAAGIGLDGSEGPLEALLRRLMSTPSCAERTRKLARELRNTTQAVSATVDVIVGAAT